MFISRQSTAGGVLLATLIASALLAAPAAGAGTIDAPDTSAPGLSVSITPVATGQNGWYREPVTFTVVAVDDTDPVPVVLASVDDDELTPSPGSFVVSDDGVHTVMVRAVDASGNGGKIIVRTIRIDSTAPTVTATRSADHRLAISATDATSGIASIEYRYVLTARNRSFSTGWRSYSAPVPALGGRLVTVEYRATDVAGTTSAVGVFR